MPTTSEPILGIDFGTTNTAAAFFDAAGKLRVVPTHAKQLVLPSVVWFHAGDKAIAGHAARTQIVDDPRHTIFGAKRFLGRRFQSEFVDQHRARFAFEVVEGKDGYAAVKVYDQVRPLTEVVHFVLKHILALANQTAGFAFKQCVLTVPAHASIRQREGMRKAAQLAGLSVRAIINEPTAAALYYANLRAPEQTVLVFDLGGGTFDATLMAVKNRVVKVLATGGDAFLGGANFDEAIVEALVSRFQAEQGIDLRQNQIVMQRLVFAAEVAKIQLSKADETAMRIPAIALKDGKFIDFHFKLTRKEVEETCFGLIERAAAATEDVLARAKLSADRVDELVLVGGQTRMPAIRARFAHFKKFATEKDIHPELAVAVGAAVLGRNLARGSSGLADVVPMPISVMLPGGRTQELIGGNTPVPCAKLLPLEGLPMWNAPIPIAVFESLGTTAVDREILGTVSIPPDWRQAQGGKGALELRMAQDFSLSARLHGLSGETKPVALIDPRPQNAA